jgi:hypothetical protein
MDIISAFKTRDGKIFETKFEADMHEMHLAKRDVFEEFLNSDFNPYQSIPQKALARNVVINWELFRMKKEQSDG